MFCNSGGARALAALVCGIVLAACNDAPTEQAPASTSGPKVSAAKVPGLAPEMVAAVSSGRSASVISVHFALGSAPALNQSLPIRIAVVPHQEFSSVRAYFETHDGLVLGSGSTLGPISGAATEKPIEHQLAVMPVRDGVYMITATVDTEGKEGSVTRVFSIPVIVAPEQDPAGATSTPPATQTPTTPASGG
jgi:hypothetical protein